MRIDEVCAHLERLAPRNLQESYDNAGLLTGDPAEACTGIICALDVTEAVIAEAKAAGANLIVAHHPVIFKGLKSLTGRHYVERIIIAAIRENMAIYAIHTNLDNVLHGVNGRIARLMGLQRTAIAAPKAGTLRKLFTFCPQGAAEKVRQALFAAGGGHIGNYSECSFNVTGTGTYRPGDGTNPYAGTPGKIHEETETRIELVFPAGLERQMLAALRAAHPYEEVAFDLVDLSNPHPETGAGVTGELPTEMPEKTFLENLSRIFGTVCIRHTAFTNRPIKRVMVCGGAGSFLIPNALSAKVDALVTADMKYHEFFEADGKMLIADIGHFESEQFTIDLLQEDLAEKFPTFAVLKTGVRTNPVHYFSGQSIGL